MIVTCGENVVDMIMRPDGLYKAVPGGSPLNIALALARLGVPSGYAMPVSSDLFGAELVSALEREGVGYLPPVRPDRPTGLAIVKVADDGQPDYSFYRQGAADIDLQPGELPSLGGDVVHLQVGGSPSLGHAHCGDVLCEWVGTVPDSVSLSVDPNVRPALVDDRQAFLRRCDELAGRCSVFRLSDEDARYMYGDVEAGKVAAGDCFYASTLSWLLDNGALAKDRACGLGEDMLRDLGRHAAAAAAINCSRDGCDPPTKDEVLALVAGEAAG